MKAQTAARTGGPSQGGSPIYGLGFIGALVWFWTQAPPDPKSRTKAVGKAMAWPAFLVHDAFKALQS
jgi:hypothetical protein